MGIGILQLQAKSNLVVSEIQYTSWYAVVGRGVGSFSKSALIDLCGQHDYYIIVLKLSYM